MTPLPSARRPDCLAGSAAARNVTDPGLIEFRRFRGHDTDAVRNLHVIALRSARAFVEMNDAVNWDGDLENIDAVYLRSGGEFLVGVIDGEIVAMGGLRLDEHGSATLKRMRVHPSRQRCGLGRELLRRLEEAARQRGVTRIVLDTLPV
jgi:GNAT superfamily N-acetyltransferase